uniref:Uncharacterized protein n=1 Tax=Panagrolaimus sp. ES5 TaxID=591445 RepID=A0AC34GS42_9BILA
MDFIFEFLAFSFLLILDFALKCGIQNRNQNVKPADDDNDESQNDNSDNEWDIVNEKEVSENPIHEISKVVSIKFEKNKECLVIDFLLVDGSTLSADYIEYDINEVLPRFSVKTKVNIDGDDFLLASLIPGILFDLQELTIWNQKLTMEEFQEVASPGSIKFLNIQSTKITESDGSLVTVNKIISNQHNLEDIELTFEDTVIDDFSDSVFLCEMEALFEFIAFSFLLILDFAVKYGIQYSNKEVLSQETKDIGLEQQQNISVDFTNQDVFAPVVENDEASNNNSDNEWDIVNEKEVSA